MTPSTLFYGSLVFYQTAFEHERLQGVSLSIRDYKLRIHARYVNQINKNESFKEIQTHLCIWTKNAKNV